MVSADAKVAEATTTAIRAESLDKVFNVPPKFRQTGAQRTKLKSNNLVTVTLDSLQSSDHTLQVAAHSTITLYLLHLASTSHPNPESETRKRTIPFPHWKRFG